MYINDIGSDIGPEEKDQSQEDVGKGKEAALGCSASVMMVLTHVGLLGCGLSFGLWAKLATRHSKILPVSGFLVPPAWKELARRQLFLFLLDLGQGQAPSAVTDLHPPGEAHAGCGPAVFALSVDSQMQEAKVLKEEGEAPAPAACVGTATRPRSLPARLGRGAPLPHRTAPHRSCSPSPQSGVYSLLLCSVQKHRRRPRRSRGGLLFKRSPLNDVCVPETLPGICKI
nr:uncharacterized protein LOC112984818 [Dromaius novaehollandiae]XP_025958727.1 uncharacterized protein LOC112984818 [Dromaius novaehollandiae]